MPGVIKKKSVWTGTFKKKFLKNMGSLDIM